MLQGILHVSYIRIGLQVPCVIYRVAANFGEANIWRLAENLQLAKF